MSHRVNYGVSKQRALHEPRLDPSQSSGNATSEPINPVTDKSFRQVLAGSRFQGAFGSGLIEAHDYNSRCKPTRIFHGFRH